MKIVTTLSGKDGSQKYLIKGEFYEECFEALLFSLPADPSNYILCISSQIGCNIACTFCATGSLGYCYNISAQDLVATVDLIEQQNKGINIAWYSFLGMGEPLNNFDNIVAFHDLMRNRNVKLSLSTVGIPERIHELADLGCPYYLFLSLHFPFDEMREQYIPINKAYPIDSIISACDYYNGKSGKKIEVSYMLLEGINDTDECLNELARLLDPLKDRIQLLLYNESLLNQQQYKRIDKGKVQNFADRLKAHNFEVSISISVAQDIFGGCGQMTGKS